MAEISKEDAERLRHIALQLLGLFEKWAEVSPTTKELRDDWKRRQCS